MILSSTTKSFIDYNQLFKFNDRDVYIPKNIKKDLDVIIYDVKNAEMDAVIVLDGAEGTGKSRTGRVLAAYFSTMVNVDFSVDNIHFNVKDYIESSENGKKWQINVLDESREALNKKRGMSKGNVSFLNWLSENRDKQQIHIIILPAVHDLENYIVAWRMLILIHHLKVHRKEGENYALDRGYFRIFTPSGELQQHITNKQKFGSYSYPKNYKYWGKFVDYEPFNDYMLVAYKNKKSEKRAEKYTEEIAPEDKEKVRLAKLFHFLKSKGVSYKSMAENSGFNEEWISDTIKRQGLGKPEKSLSATSPINNNKKNNQSTEWLNNNE
jgi:hypothetical protein